MGMVSRTTAAAVLLTHQTRDGKACDHCGEAYPCSSARLAFGYLEHAADAERLDTALNELIRQQNATNQDLGAVEHDKGVAVEKIRLIREIHRHVSPHDLVDKVYKHVCPQCQMVWPCQTARIVYDDAEIQEACERLDASATVA